MAMYYYARKLQKAARKAKTQNPPQPPTPMVNGCIPNAPNTHPPTGTLQHPVASTSSAANRTSILKPSETFVNGLVYFDAQLVAGTLEALIQRLVPSQTNYPDRAYIFAFLLASRLHIASSEVLGRVFSLALTTPPTQSSLSPALHRAAGRETTVVSQMVQLLGEWTQLFPYDFRDERMMANVRKITEKCVASEPRVGKEVEKLLETLLTRLTTLERHEALLHRMMTETTLAEPLTAPSILTVCPSPTILAQQLSHLELDRLVHIGPQEFVQGFPKESAQAESMKCRDAKKTRNLESYLQWHYRLTLYVATEICKLPKKKLRVRVIELWIETANECFNIGNFNSLTAIIAALNMCQVERLKKTWSKIHSPAFAVLEEQINPSNDYGVYRASLEIAMARAVIGLSTERKRLVIPFLPLFVKDLRFLTEQCAIKLDTDLIDFDKFWNMAKKVTEFISWQEISCPFPKVQSVISSLQTPSVFSENALHLASYECESPNTSTEKEHLKSLRGETTPNPSRIQPPILPQHQVELK